MTSKKTSKNTPSASKTKREKENEALFWVAFHAERRRIFGHAKVYGGAFHTESWRVLSEDVPHVAWPLIAGGASLSSSEGELPDEIEEVGITLTGEKGSSAQQLIVRGARMLAERSMRFGDSLLARLLNAHHVPVVGNIAFGPLGVGLSTEKLRERRGTPVRESYLCLIPPALRETAKTYLKLRWLQLGDTDSTRVENTPALAYSCLYVNDIIIVPELARNFVGFVADTAKENVFEYDAAVNHASVSLDLGAGKISASVYQSCGMSWSPKGKERVFSVGTEE